MQGQLMIQAKAVITELIEKAKLKAGDIVVIGCSTSEIVGSKIGTNSSPDTAVTVMSFSSGAIAINETGFVSNYSPVTLEVFGENGYVRMVKDNVVKCTKETEGVEVSVEIGKDLPAPIEQFMTGNVYEGCGMKEAKALTHMMTMAYAKN